MIIKRQLFFTSMDFECYKANIKCIQAIYIVYLSENHQQQRVFLIRIIQMTCQSLLL